MEPSLLIRRLHQGRSEDADRAQSLLHVVLTAYGEKQWLCAPATDPALPGALFSPTSLRSTGFGSPRIHHLTGRLFSTP